jgi:chromosome segregation ATPase
MTSHSFRLIMLTPLAVLLASCAIKPLPPDPGTVVPVKETPSGVPLFNDAREASTEADKQNVVSWEKFKTVQEQVARARRDAEAANVLAAGLRAAKTVVAADLAKLLDKVGEYKRMIDDLGDRAVELETSLAAERKLREAAATRYAAAGNALVEKEKEASVLREQMAMAGSATEAARKRADAASAEAAKSAADANRLRGANTLKNKLLAGMGGFCLLLIVVIWILIKRRTLLPI